MRRHSRGSGLDQLQKLDEEECKSGAHHSTKKIQREEDKLESEFNK